MSTSELDLQALAKAAEAFGRASPDSGDYVRLQLAISAYLAARPATLTIVGGVKTELEQAIRILNEGNTAKYHFVREAVDVLRKVAALRSQPQGREEWQDIATAPKDGSWILGAVPTHDDPKIRPLWMLFWSDRDKGWSQGSWLFEPTHWQPLPKPPAKSIQPLVETE